MSAPIAVRNDFEADELRLLAGKVKDANQARRPLAIAAIYDGMDREEASRIGGMNCQTLRVRHRETRVLRRLRSDNGQDLSDEPRRNRPACAGEEAHAEPDTNLV